MNNYLQNTYQMIKFLKVVYLGIYLNKNNDVVQITLPSLIFFLQKNILNIMRCKF